MSEALTIQVAEDRTPCFDLRRRVFVKEQGFDEEGEFDALDAVSVHILATRGTLPIGTARLIEEGDTGRIGRICVAPEARGQGIGAALVRHGIATFAGQGKTRVVLGAQLRAAGFYAGLGFAPCGPVYDEEGVPHHDMELRLD